ncbi:MAG TPA: glycosyltransferase family 9 protein [Chthoniobacteraceae bacterium]|nr:glycosyltransferase family 9 protein [Chthoniobacteraceae bacterium]
MSVDTAGLMRGTTGPGAKIRWHANRFFLGRLRLAELLRARLTVFDAFGAPGDTLLSATVCRNVKRCFPNLLLNLITPNPELVARDPNIDETNAPESRLCVWSWYLDHITRKDPGSNVHEPIARALRIPDYEYRARVYLDDAERKEAAALLERNGLPVLAFNMLSKEPVKNWPPERWLEVIESLRGRFHLVHLGDGREPIIPGVQRFAGTLEMRQSMAVLSAADLHVGPDSFLMHAANGLGVPSVIIHGASRPPESLGYRGNINLAVKIPCGPCWIHESRGERCAHGLECLRKITAGEVRDAILRLARERNIIPAA